MSLNVSGEKCPVCHAYLFEDDDIVYCPECGAPHHRDCYESLGHCGMQDFHGTENQYSRPVKDEKNISEIQNKTDIHADETVCVMCGEVFDKNNQACPKCGAPNVEKMGGRFVNFDFLGGVPADMDLGAGVTADEAKQFVGANTQRYIPKFAAFKSGKKSSWNWLAFLAPGAWFLSRKMYTLGAFVCALQIAVQMLRLPFAKAISHFDFSDAKSYFDVSETIVKNMPDIGYAVFIAAVVGVFLSLLIRILSAVFGDLKYRNNVMAKVSELKKSSNDFSADARKKGGISFAWALVAIITVQYLPAIIATFI